MNRLNIPKILRYVRMKKELADLEKEVFKDVEEFLEGKPFSYEPLAYMKKIPKTPVIVFGIALKDLAIFEDGTYAIVYPNRYELYLENGKLVESKFFKR